LSWEKIGVTVVSKPVAHGSGLYVRIAKGIAEAYDLFTAEKVEMTIDRALRHVEEASKAARHNIVSVRVMDKNTSPKSAPPEGSLPSSEGRRRRGRPRTSGAEGGQST